MRSRQFPAWVVVSTVALLLVPATGLLAGPIALCCEAHHCATMAANGLPDCCVDAEPGHMCPMDMVATPGTTDTVTASCGCGRHDAGLTVLVILFGLGPQPSGGLTDPDVTVQGVPSTPDTFAAPRQPALPPPRL